MSKQKRSGKPFRTLGQRMLSFGRDVMRTYSNEVSLQPDTTSQPSRPQGQWRSMTNNGLVWRKEQPTSAPQQAQQPSAPADMDYDDAFYQQESDYQPFAPPIQRRPQQPQQPQPVQRQPQRPQPSQQPQQPKKPAPNYVQTDDGTPVKVSRKQFDSPLQRRLEAIMAAHEEVQSERDQKRDQKIENIQRKVESGELSTRRRRGSIDVDYVKTDSLLSPEDRDKVQTKREDSTPAESTPEPTNDATDDDSQWFDEVPDDDADIDNIAGFESSDDMEGLPDDLPRFDPSSLEGGETDNDMGEFEGGYDAVDPSVATDKQIDRAYDEDYPVQDFDDSGDTVDSQPMSSDTPIQRTPQDDLNDLPTFDDFDSDETVPLVPDVDTSSPAPSSDNTPVQRSESADSDEDNFLTETADDTSDNTPDVSNRPVQRRPIQRQESDTPADEDGDYPVQDFDAPTFEDAFSDTDAPPSVDSTPGDNTPVQRRIQRTPQDSPDVDNSSELGDGGDYQEFGDQTWSEANNLSSDDLPDITPTGDAPVQRSEIDEPQFDDVGDDIEMGDLPDVNAFDTPSAGQSSDAPIQRAELDEPQFDDYGDDIEMGDLPDVNAFDTPSAGQSSDAPIQRTEIDEPQFDDYGDDDVDLSDDADFSDMSSMDAPIQRTEFDDADDYSDYDAFPNETPSVDAPNRGDTPIQRSEIDGSQFEEYSDVGQDDYNDYSEAGDFPTVNESPTDNAPVQRQTDDDDLHVDVPPADSLTVEQPKANTPAQPNQIQRTPSEDVTPEPTRSEDNTPTPSTTSEPTVQRREIDRDHPDLGDGGAYQDLGDDTWAEANNISSDTLPDITTTGDAPVQRTELDEPQFDDYSDDVEMNDLPDVNAFDAPTASSDSPAQRSEVDEYSDADVDVYNEVPDVNAFDAPSNDAPVQGSQDDTLQGDDSPMDSLTVEQPKSDSPSQRPVQRRIQRTEDDTPQIDDAPMDSLSVESPSNNGPVQRRIQRTEDDAPQGDDMPMDSLTVEQPKADSPSQRPVQRQQSDPAPETYEEEFGDQTWAEANDYSPATDTPDASIQRQEIESAPETYEDEYGDQTWAEANDYSPATDTSDVPIQRQEMESAPETYEEEFGNQTWAEANDYSPATDANDTSGAPIQREVDDQNTLPTFDDFDGVEDTDGMTAMNILSDYLSEQNSGDATSTPTGDNAPVQRDYQDGEDFEYLPEGFDPTPQIYNFDSPNSHPSSPSDAPIQRTPQADMGEPEPQNQQPMDLFSALSQMGAVKSDGNGNDSSSPVQRDMQDDSYDDYGDMTWAEMNDYSPATDQANDNIQRSADDNYEPESQNAQPMDLFSALAQEGVVKRSSNTSANNSPIQRSPQESGDSDGISSDMADLYNAMMDSGMIRQPDTSAYTQGNTSSSEPIQRKEKPQQQSVDLGEALRQATQVSDSSAFNSSESSKLGGSAPVGKIQRDTDSGTGPATSSEVADTASTDGDDTDAKVTVEDKRYLDQLARDVFRVIKRRLREEKERRG